MKVKYGHTFLIVFFAAIFSATLNAKSLDEDNEIKYEVISKGQFSGVTHQMSMVVQDAMEFEMLWQHHSKGSLVADPMPKVDFANETVIAHFLGGTPTCGYDIQTTEIEDHAGYVEAKSLTTISRNIIVCLVATQPFEFVKTKRLNNIVTFKQKASVR